MLQCGVLRLSHTTPDIWRSAGRRGDVEQGKGERVAPGVTKQRLVNADARWGDTGTTENLSQGQQRPSSLRGPGPKTPRAPRPAGGAVLESLSKGCSPSRAGMMPLLESGGNPPPCINEQM